MQKRLLAAAILAGLSLSLAACGGSDDDTPEPPPPAPEPGPGPSPDPDPGPAPDPDPTPDPDPGPDPDPDPGPGPDPDPDPTPGGAGECVNPAEYQVGSTWRLEYRVSGLFTGTSVTDAKVERRTDFAGYSALETEVLTTTSYTGLPRVETSVLNYADMVGGNLLEMYGNRVEADVMGLKSTTVSTYTPPWRNPMWTLAAGQTETYTYTMRSETTITGAPVPVPPTITEHTASGSYTFDGRQSVTVPVGTFNACKFTQAEEGTTNEMWFAPGMGVMVKSISAKPGEGSLTLEMTTGRFNGANIAP